MLENGKWTSKLPELLEMFGKWSPGCPLHLCLRQLRFKMLDDVISKVYIIIRKESEKLSITFRWGRSSIWWSIGIWCRCNDQSMARRALSLLGCSLSAGHLVFSASSDISKGWCIIADKRVICWWRVFDRLSASADCWGWSTIDLLRVFVRIQRDNTRWEMQQKKIFVCTSSLVPW
jgi:hypothetical protein